LITKFRGLAEPRIDFLLRGRRDHRRDGLIGGLRASDALGVERLETGEGGVEIDLIDDHVRVFPLPAII
jgi:hypothetical protein